MPTEAVEGDLGAQEVEEVQEGVGQLQMMGLQEEAMVEGEEDAGVVGIEEATTKVARTWSMSLSPTPITHKDDASRRDKVLEETLAQTFLQLGTTKIFPKSVSPESLLSIAGSYSIHCTSP